MDQIITGIYFIGSTIYSSYQYKYYIYSKKYYTIIIYYFKINNYEGITL